MLLQDLKAGIDDPLTGAELVAAFFGTDKGIFGRCDDSSGRIGDIFRFEAKELFTEYASRCGDKEKIAKIILRLNRTDDYGIRDKLVACAGECLPETVIRSMISEFQKRAGKEEDERKKCHHLRLVESLARQIKDARLFEETRREAWGELSTAAFIDIAEVYLESGEVETAYSWIMKIPQGETFQADERDQLLLEIYRQQGNTEKLTNLLYRRFRACHSVNSLQKLLEVIGHDQRDEVIAAETALILKSTTFKESDAGFMITTGKIDAAETYLLGRAEQLNGDHYGSLLPLAETMASENRNLAASLLYRSLLLSILKRGHTKAYPYGIRYLKKLDKLSETITDWQNFDNHKVFKAQILLTHGRKRSFWSKYER
jgi:hypothetical protein